MDIEHENILGLTTSIGTLLEWAEANDFRAHDGWGSGRAMAPVAPQEGQGAAQPKQAEVRCGVCGGPVWDNNAGKGKTNPKAPDWTCKDKEGCWSRAWAKADGTPGEWKAPPV